MGGGREEKGEVGGKWGGGRNGAGTKKRGWEIEKHDWGGGGQEGGKRKEEISENV